MNNVRKGVVSSLPCASFRSFGQYALASSHWENDKEGKMSFKNYVAFKRGIPPPTFARVPVTAPCLYRLLPFGKLQR
jgi:hypothetical protein